MQLGLSRKSSSSVGRHRVIVPQGHARSCRQKSASRLQSSPFDGDLKEFHPSRQPLVAKRLPAFGVPHARAVVQGEFAQDVIRVEHALSAKAKPASSFGAKPSTRAA